MGVKVVYHYSEPGHGKGPHDGIGATIKHGLDRLVIQDKVRLRNAYEVYIAACKYLSQVGHNADAAVQKDLEFSKRVIRYVPHRMTKNAPNEKVRAIKGTLKLRNVQALSNDTLEVANLSCGCVKCISGIGDRCLYEQWRKTDIQHLRETENPPEATDDGETANTCIHLDLTNTLLPIHKCMSACSVCFKMHAMYTLVLSV